MALDLKALKAKLTQLQTKGGGNPHLFKPQEGETRIRIVPLKGSPENPFTELYFHYLGNKTYLSPLSYGEKDPIAEFSDMLIAEGNLSKEEYKQAKKFAPQMRTYVPVVVRGKENEGVKFWAFGKTIYQDLITIMADEDFGDITDVMNGRDIKVTFTPKEKSDTDFAKTAIIVSPKQSKLHEDSAVVEKLLNDQPSIDELYPRHSYADLQDVLEKFLNAGSAKAPSGPKPTAAKAEDDEWASEPTPAKASKAEAKPSVDVEAEFDELFNN